MVLNTILRKLVTIVVPIGLGIWIIVWSMSGLSANDKKEIENAFINANYFWIVIAILIGILSHIIRAYRWQYLLQPLGYQPKFLNSFFSVFIGYIVNLIIPRGGEVVRATSLSKYENIPFDKTFGTVIAERIVDMILLGIIVLVALFYQFQYFSGIIASKIPKNPIVILFSFVLLFVLGWQIYRLMKFSNHLFFVKIRKFVEGFTEGLISVWKMQKRWSFIVQSILIWVLYVLMFYVVTLSFTGTSNMDFGAVISGFVAGAFGTTANGGLGTFPLAVKEVFSLYQVPLNEAWAFGWLMWSAQTLLILLFGLLSVFLMPLYNRKFN